MKKLSTLFSIMALSVIVGTTAFAQENSFKSAVIASVNLVNQGIVKQEGRLFTLGVNIQNKIGTQGGVMYGVQTYQIVDEKRILVDEFAILDPLTLKQGEYAYKEFIYPVPASVSGKVELFAFLKTDEGILLATAPFGTTEIAATPVPADIGGCAVDKTAQTFTCTVTNTTNKVQNVVVVTQVKQGNSVFAPIAQTLAPQVVTLKSKEKKSIVQAIDAAVFSNNAFFETVLIDQKDSSLIERLTVTYVSPSQPRKISNILIDQTSAKDYLIKIISLGGRTPANVRITISDAKGVCATQETVVESAITSVPFTLTKACNTTQVSASILDIGGKMVNTKDIAHKTLFPQKNNTKTILFILGLLALVSGYVVIKKKENEVTLKA
ncbi:MAG: hypothetical protein WAV09_03545 [Minisyncoccia bacterium]